MTAAEAGSRQLILDFIAGAVDPVIQVQGRTDDCAQNKTDHDDKNIAGDNGALYADDHGDHRDAGHDRFGIALLYPAAAQDSDQSSDNHRDGVNNYSKHVDLPFSSSVFVF